MPFAMEELPSQWMVSHLNGLNCLDDFRIREAKEWFDKSLNLSISANDLVGIGTNYCELGKMYTNANLFDVASNYLDEALHIFEELDDPQGVASCLQGLADLNLRLGKVDDALRMATRGKRLVEQFGCPDDVKVFETRINMLEKHQDIHMVVFDPEEYRRQMGPSEDELKELPKSGLNRKEEVNKRNFFPVSVGLEGFPPPARFRDVLDAFVRSWTLTDQELTEKFGDGWCILPDLDKVINAGGSHRYTIAQLKQYEDAGFLMIQGGKVGIILRVRDEIAREGEGDNQQFIIESFHRHWASVTGIPLKLPKLEKLTLRSRENGTIEVVQPGIQNIRFKLPIPRSEHVQNLIPLINKALTDAYREISTFAGAAWCRNWAHVLPPVMERDLIEHLLNQGHSPACVLYPEKGYADIDLAVLEKVEDLKAIQGCIEKHWNRNILLETSRSSGGRALTWFMLKAFFLIVVIVILWELIQHFLT